MKNIIFIGSGAIATAIGHILAIKNEHQIHLLSIEDDVIESINNFRINNKYFPNVKLRKTLRATSDKNVLTDAYIIFLAIPSSKTLDYIKQNQNIINPNAILVNLAKGFGDDNRTIVQCLKDVSNNPIATIKGPSFARDIINKLHTGLTVGTEDSEIFSTLKNVFKETNIYLDYSNDINGVELLSILKNIYAIAMGIVDAQHDSPNLRFLVLTNAFKEMRNLLIQFGGKEETLFKYCGFGDFGLTALNDLSRNRTLGLLIGKGFFSQDISDNVLLEGRIAVNVFCEEIAKKHSIDDFHIISELYKIFNKNKNVSAFVNAILIKE